MADGRADVVLRSRRTVLPDGERPAAVTVAAGKVVAVAAFDSAVSAAEDVDLGEDVLLPGLVDTHVHVNEPGRTEWEGFRTATRAAAAGGVTTILDMPLNSVPPTVNVGALREKQRAAAGQVLVDVGFWAGAVPDNLGALPALRAAGVFGFKCFLVDSGVPEFPPLDEIGLRRAAAAVADLGARLIVHAEDAGTIDAAPPPTGRCYRDFLESRPAAAEDRAIERLIRLSAATGCRTHVVHLSSSGALAAVAEARAAGVPITAETCPHYLALAAEDVPDGATQFKCCPPVRESANRELLWDGLRAGTIDCVVSDHSPCPPALKALDSGDFGTAWGGIASLQLGLAVVWTQASRRGVGLTDVVRWMSTAPAALAGLPGKGAIAVGRDADFAVFAPDQTFRVDPRRLWHRHRLTPYAGMPLRGVVRETWLRGRRISDGTPRGRLLEEVT